MAQSDQFKVGQLVWAKVKGYGFWPAVVMNETLLPVISITAPKKRYECFVQFFGTDEYGFAEEAIPYLEFRSRYGDGVKKKPLINAVIDADKYAVDHPECKAMENGEVMPARSVAKMKTKNHYPSPALNIDDEDDDEREDTDEDEEEDEAEAKRVGKKRSAPKSDGRNGSTSSKVEEAAAKRVAKKRSAPISNGHGGSTSSKRVASSMQPVQVKMDLKDKKIGFIGLGMYGSRLVRHMILNKFNVTIYEDSGNKGQQEFAKIPRARSPRALVEKCDIVFCCVPDLNEARDMFYGENGACDGMGQGKAYVEMSTIDPQSAMEMFNTAKDLGCRYLEAPLSGLKKEADDGRMAFLCAGDKTLFDDCGPVFQSIGRKAFFFGDAGNAAKMRLLHQLLAGIMVSGVAEVAAIANNSGLSVDDFYDIIGDSSPMGCSLIRQTVAAMRDNDNEPSHPLGQMQREIQVALTYSGFDLTQPTLVASAANQLMLLARKNGKDSKDAAAAQAMYSFLAPGEQDLPNSPSTSSGD